MKHQPGRVGSTDRYRDLAPGSLIVETPYQVHVPNANALHLPLHTWKQRFALWLRLGACTDTQNLYSCLRFIAKRRLCHVQARAQGSGQVPLDEIVGRPYDKPDRRSRFCE